MTSTSREVSKRGLASHSRISSRVAWAVRCAPSTTDAAPGAGDPAPGTRATTASGAPSTASRAAAPYPSRTTAWTGVPPVGAGTRSMPNRSSWCAVPRRASGARERRTSESTVTTGCPEGSVACRVTPSAPLRASRTRRVLAPAAWSRTPVQANGSLPRPVPMPSPVPSRDSTARACRAASRSAGCSPKRAASSPGRVTSAKTSWPGPAPRRQAERSPWKAGP